MKKNFRSSRKYNGVRYKAPKREEGLEWKNRGYEVYQDLIDDDDKFREKLFKQFKDVTAGHGEKSVLRNISDKINKTRYGFFHQSLLAHDNHKGHPRPVGGLGFAKIVNHPCFPKHDFFRAGRIFQIRLRHNNLAFEDDALLDGRVTCLKFCDEDSGGPLDLILHTGTTAQFYNAASFAEFYNAFGKGESGLKDWIHKKPINCYGRIENVRREPGSYYELQYHSHVTYQFSALESTSYMARLRLLPADECEETGLPGKYDQEHLWVVDRWQSKNGTKSKNYLRQEFKHRLRYRPLQYRLQIQLRNVEDDFNSHLLNPCLEWDNTIWQWVDLAVITLTTPLSEDALIKTTFTLVNHMESFAPAQSESPNDFASVSLVLREFHGCCSKFHLTEADTSHYTGTGSGRVCDRDKVDVSSLKYKVFVKTGCYPNAGTDTDVFLTITGTKGRTRMYDLDNTFHNDFERDQIDVFEIETENIGEILVIRIEIKSLLPNRQWFLEHAMLQEMSSNRFTRFPCYRWLTSGSPFVTLRKAKAITPQNEAHMFSYLYRKYELQERQALYQWDKIDGLPGRVKTSRYDDIPREAQFEFEKEQDLRIKYMRTLANTGVGTVKTIFDNTWDVFSDYQKLIRNLLTNTELVNTISTVWKNDEEFGRQFLNGPHPTWIRRLRAIPENLPITHEMVQDFLGEGLTLDKEIEEGHVYVASYPELEKFHRSKTDESKHGRYMTSPICVLHSRNDGTLVPIAIQLHQKPSEDNPIWTPADREHDWLFAKMWVHEADAQVHQVISCHLMTHLVLEAFAVATMRCLASNHPIYKLLEPHLRHTIAINVLGRWSLYSTEEGIFTKYLAIGGQHSELLKTAYKNFSLDSLNFPKSLRRRGVDDDRKLPNYFYRDDGCALWNVISKFVRTVLTVHYWTNDNIRLDEELQEWITDLTLNGFPVFEENTDHGVATALYSLEEVTDLVTSVIFAASCQYSAVTSGTMDYYTFTPNYPTILLGRPPTTKGIVTMETIKDAMPGRVKTAEIISSCYALSTRNKDEISLGHFPRVYFEDELTRSAIEAFQEDLARVGDQIRERNKKLSIPYTYFDTNRLPGHVFE